MHRSDQKGRSTFVCFVPEFFCANAFSRTGYTYVNFVPTLGKTAVDGDVKDILILNTSGTLVHPSATGNMKGFRVRADLQSDRCEYKHL